MHVRVAGPDGYRPRDAMFERASSIGAVTGGSVAASSDPRAAVEGADVVVTDTWVSMGMEEEKAAREAVFASYTVDGELLSRARPDAIVLHCLPAYRGKEIAAEVIDGPQSVVWDEAENRRHAQKAVLSFLVEQSAEST
jgi:ornithine carbamoyltransferase